MCTSILKSLQGSECPHHSCFFCQIFIFIIIPGHSSYTKINELQEKGDKSDEIKICLQPEKLSFMKDISTYHQFSKKSIKKCLYHEKYHVNLASV